MSAAGSTRDPYAVTRSRSVVASTRPADVHMTRVLIVIVCVLLLGVGVLTVVVERESEYAVETVSGAGAGRALVLYHPSRDAHSSDDISLAFARGLEAAGFAVDRR